MSEQSFLQSNRKSEYPWYLPSIDKHLVPKTRELLEKYSGIPPEQQSQHVNAIRDQAWAIRPYPCVGLGIFLEPTLPRSLAYQTVLERIKCGGTFLDVGCFFGGEMRQLVFDGAPSDKMYGIDIVSFWDTGYSLYRDKDRFAAQFMEMDLLDTENEQMNALNGCVDVISISAVLHLWLWEKQVEGAKRLAQLSSGPGALVVGYQVGTPEARNKTWPGMDPVWVHSIDSFAKMWDHVGQETGTSWETKARLISWEELGWDTNELTWLKTDDRVMDFVVTRVK